MRIQPIQIAGQFRRLAGDISLTLGKIFGIPLPFRFALNSLLFADQPIDAIDEVLDFGPLVGNLLVALAAEQQLQQLRQILLNRVLSLRRLVQLFLFQQLDEVFHLTIDLLSACFVRTLAATGRPVSDRWPALPRPCAR